MLRLAYIVDNDKSFYSQCARILLSEGFLCIHHSSLRTLRESLGRREIPGLVVLELALPDGHALDLISQLVDLHGAAVIVVSTSNDPVVIASALDNGASDYVRKPVAPKEFAARLRKATQNGKASADGITFGSGSDAVHFDKHHLALTADGQRRLLTDIEGRILLVLSRSQGTPTSKSLLYALIWDLEYLPGDRKLDVRVNALNKKIETLCGDRLRIRSVRKAGYLLHLQNEA